MDRHHIVQLVIAVLHYHIVLAVGRQLPADVVTIRACTPPNHLASRFAYANPMLMTFQGVVVCWMPTLSWRSQWLYIYW